MSDIGLFPPGAAVWLYSLGWMVLCAVGLLVSLLVAWLRSRRRMQKLTRDAFFGWAIGSVVSAVAAGTSMLLVDWSGSLGKFAHWLDQSLVSAIWMAGIVALWPLVAIVWNRLPRGGSDSASS